MCDESTSEQRFELEQGNRYNESVVTALSSGVDAQQDERGYTIVVPASVCIRGVNMKLDLKIDQKTLAAASNITKAVEEAVTTHFSSANASTMEADKTNRPRIVCIPSTQPRLNFAVTERGETHFDCDSSIEDILSFVTKEEQVNEVCSSTVDSSPFCDTACSPIHPNTQVSTEMQHQAKFINQKCGTPVDVTFIDDPWPSCSMRTFLSPDNEVHSSLDDSSNGVAMTASKLASNNTFLMSTAPSASSMRADDAVTLQLPPKRRKEKSANTSRFCEHNDPKGKGQCRQRAILNYRYCIRHILFDPNAPYRQCQHKRKPKSKKDVNLLCTNAVRNDRNMMFCSTHMIMQGMMEPKRKRNSAAVQVDRNFKVEVGGQNDIVDGWKKNGPPCKKPNKMKFSPTHSLPFIADKRSVDNDWMDEKIVIKTPAYDLNGFVVDQEQQPANYFTSTVCQSLPPFSAITNSNFCLSFSSPCQITTDQPSIRQLELQTPSLPQGSEQTFSNQPTARFHSLLAPSSTARNHLRGTSSNLTKQHPQLAAKLLQAPSIIVPSPAVTNLPPAICTNAVPPGAPPPAAPPPAAPPPVISTALSSDSMRNANRRPIRGLEILPWNAPTILRRKITSFTREPVEYCEPDVANESLMYPVQKKPRVIRLKQKRQALKMTGKYRKIPQVDQMCKLIDDCDFNRSDLFPLGLEPSDDEDEEDDCGDFRWPLSACKLSDNSQCYGPSEVYLLKKQLRVDKVTLSQQAIMNAPILHASKSYPNSVGAALSHRSSRLGLTSEQYKVEKRCSYLVQNDSSSFSQCESKCLPMSSHCSKHILYNIHQKLFSYCGEPLCGRPVLCTDMPSTKGLCRIHYSSRKDSYECPRGVIVNLLEQTPITSYNMDSQKLLTLDRSNTLPTLYQAQSDTYRKETGEVDRSTNAFINPILGDTEYSCVNDMDASFVANDLDLGFDGPELYAMLGNLPTDDSDPTYLLRENFSDCLKDEDFTIPSGFDSLGHDWADVEQFLLSEGYPVALTPSPTDLPLATGMQSTEATFNNYHGRSLMQSSPLNSNHSVTSFADNFYPNIS